MQYSVKRNYSESVESEVQIISRFGVIINSRREFSGEVERMGLICRQINSPCLLNPVKVMAVMMAWRVRDKPAEIWKQ